MGGADVSVVVVSWRSRELALACLRSIERAAARSPLEVETVVVDNASNDGTLEAIASEHPRAILVASERNLGFAAGCNAGAARASGRLLLLLNPDAEIAHDALDALVAALDDAPRAGAAGCQLVGADGEAQFSCGRFLTPFNQAAESLGLSRFLPVRALRRSYLARELEGERVEVDWVVGACLAVRHDVWASVGGLDERYFMYSEDEDLCFRLQRAGWRVLFLPRVSVRHVGGGSARHALDAMRGEARRSQCRFIREHRGRAAELLFRATSWIAARKPRRAPERVGWGA